MEIQDTRCVVCEIKEETMTHFMEVEIWFNLRKKKLQEAGRDSNPSSKLLDSFVWQLILFTFLLFYFLFSFV